MAIVYLSLGSNKEPKMDYLQQATSLLCLDNRVKIIRTSAFYETEPWGNKNQEWFINAVIEARVDLSPDNLLKLCNDVEQKLGRSRETEERWGARCIDIDILFYDDEIIDKPDLTIPHKYIQERAFVLVPLLELVPDFVHPVFDKTITELYDKLEIPEEVFLYGARF